MLHTVQSGTAVPGPYAMQLHREAQDRRARLKLAALRVVKAPAPQLDLPMPATAGILVYPARVFADDCDREATWADTVDAAAATPSRVREIQDLICRHLKVLRSDMLSQRRDRAAVIARQVAMYLCKRHTPMSCPDIGRRFGGRDHTTVLSANWRVEAIMAGAMGTDTSPQWKAANSDFVRRTVNAAEAEISTWPGRRISRKRHVTRSAK